MLLTLSLLLVQGMDPLEPYRVLTDTRSDVVNFFPEPSTGMVVNADGDVWCVQPSGNSLVKIDDGLFDTLGTPGSSVDRTPVGDPVVTGLNPVALATWTDTNGPVEFTGERLLVVCAGSHALFVHDAVTGEFLDAVRLEAVASELGDGVWLSEGAEVVVDPATDTAFVSCPSSNTVLEIFLDVALGAPLEVTRTYHLPVGQRPGATRPGRRTGACWSR